MFDAFYILLGRIHLFFYIYFPQFLSVKKSWIISGPGVRGVKKKKKTYNLPEICFKYLDFKNVT
jgi:hypothetical protein